MKAEYTKKSIKGKTFKVLRIVNGSSIEDIPAIRQNLQGQIENIDGATMEETETVWNFNNGQFVMKPACHRETLGFLKCGPSFAKFDGCRIEYKDMTIDSDFAIIETPFAKYAIHGTV